VRRARLHETVELDQHECENAVREGVARVGGDGLAEHALGEIGTPAIEKLQRAEQVSFGELAHDRLRYSTISS
jgi:hypothetical protein